MPELSIGAPDPTGVREAMYRPDMQPITLKMIDNMEKVIIYRGQGLTVDEACKQCKLSRKTYEKWRTRWPQFARIVDRASIEYRKSLDENAIPVKDDFSGFRMKYFKHENAPFHDRMIWELENAKPGSITMILVPPDHGKTTTLTDYVCWKLGLDPNHRFLYISESSKLAAKVLGRIKRRMTDPSVAGAYQRDFGPFYQPGQEKQAKPWAAEFMTVYKSNHDEQDYSLEAMGWVSQIYGVRSDTIILDDFQTLKTAEKGNTTDAMVDKFQQDIYTRIDPDHGKVFIIGTRVAMEDFYVKLLNQGTVVDNVIILPAIDAEGKALWEARIPLVKLKQIERKVGPKIWARAYMMTPQDDGMATFQLEVLNDCKKTNLVVWGAADATEDVWAGIDPAIDNFTAITTAAITTERMRLISSEHFPQLATGEAILAAIQRTWERTHFTKLMVEAVSFQKALARDERLEKMRRDCGFTIVEHTTSSNKMDATFGVARMASSFIDDTIWIPAGNEASNQHFLGLIAELVQWRATIPTRLRVQDMVMSLWFIWVQWQKYRKAHEERTGSIQGAGMPWKPTSYRPGFKYRGTVLR